MKKTDVQKFVICKKDFLSHNWFISRFDVSCGNTFSKSVGKVFVGSKGSGKNIVCVRFV